MRILKKKGSKLTKWDIQDYLKTPEDLANYLEAALETNDPVFLRIAVNDIITALEENKK